MKRMMQLLAVCVSVIAIATGLALTVVDSEWGMALLAGGGVALVALTLCGGRRDKQTAPAAPQWAEFKPEQPDPFDFFWNNAYALGERPWTHNIHTTAPRPRSGELN